MIDQATLKNHIGYDPDTGQFTRPGRPGVKVGGVNTLGYVVISVLGTRYYAHRLAWLYTNGEWPEVIDHINGNRSDNRLCNLRSVTHQVNQQNLRRAQKNSTHGFLGVCYHKNRRGTKLYSARIHVDGAYKHLGYFKTPEEAHDAYMLAKKEIHAGYIAEAQSILRDIGVNPSCITTTRL